MKLNRAKAVLKVHRLLKKRIKPTVLRYSIMGSRRRSIMDIELIVRDGFNPLTKEQKQRLKNNYKQGFKIPK